MLDQRQMIFRRRFLVTGLPKGNGAADSHLQIFDNYLLNTDLRLRKQRDPATDEYSYFLDKTVRRAEYSFEVSRIELSVDEYDVFAGFRGREIRKNRYQINLGTTPYHFEVFLGALRGLSLAAAYSEDRASIDAISLPAAVLHEVSADSFYDGQNLVDVDIEAVETHLNKKESI